MLLPMLGFFDGIYSILSAAMQPLYWVVSGLVVFFHSIFSPVFGFDSGWSWTLAIIMLTVTIRTLLIPLFVKQINSSRNMQLIQPKVQELQKKYGHDRNRLGQETMKLYSEEGVNPAASCLPLLVQTPIMLALLRVLDGAARNQVRGHWFVQSPELVHSLQNSRIFGVSMADTFLPLQPFGARHIFTGILVLLMVGVLFITQLQLMRKNMPPEALTGPMAQQQKILLYLFPLMFLGSGLAFPVGVLVYWLTSNLWTMGQQYILIRNNPAANTPAYIDWEERMRAKGKDPDEIQRKRIAKLRGTDKKPTSRVVGADAATAEGTADNETGAGIQRQQVTRQTVRRTTDGGKQVVARSQPTKATRSARKKK